MYVLIMFHSDPFRRKMSNHENLWYEITTKEEIKAAFNKSIHNIIFYLNKHIFHIYAIF